MYFPIHVKTETTAHWMLAIAFVENHTLQLYDSRREGVRFAGMEHLGTLRAYLRQEHEDKRGHPDSRDWNLIPCTECTPRQQNDMDSGVFVLAFCKHFSSEDGSRHFNPEVDASRNHLAKSILDAEVSD